MIYFTIQEGKSKFYPFDENETKQPQQIRVIERRSSFEFRVFTKFFKLDKTLISLKLINYHNFPQSSLSSLNFY